MDPCPKRRRALSSAVSGSCRSAAKILLTISRWRPSASRCFSADAGVVARAAVGIAAVAKRRRSPATYLSSQNVLEARAVVDAVDHLGHPLHPRLVADRSAGVEGDRPERRPRLASFRSPIPTVAASLGRSPSIAGRSAHRPHGCSIHHSCARRRRGDPLDIGSRQGGRNA